MERILLRAEAASRGLGDRDLARLSQLGDLERVRRGAYVRPAAQEQTPEQQHRLLIEATMPLLGWQVVRWIWSDLDRPAVIAERLRRAFLRAHA